MTKYKPTVTLFLIAAILNLLLNACRSDEDVHHFLDLSPLLTSDDSYWLALAEKVQLAV